MAQIMVSTVVFKFVNLFALLGYLLNIISLFSDYNSDPADIVNGIFHLISIVVLLTIEVDERPILAKYVPFLFSFVGRGVFYIWLSWITFQLSILSIIGTIFTFVVGIIYVLLFILKNLQAPTTMSFEETYTENPQTYFSESASFLPTHTTPAEAQAQDEEARYLAI